MRIRRIKVIRRHTYQVPDDLVRHRHPTPPRGRGCLQLRPSAVQSVERLRDQVLGVVFGAEL
ncbi:hypothetical protein ABT237_05660 [Streptomyces sp. NPDC001581]|uniref:hypothetical protein n=1 Tax=Streptomyces sp. NPDC001581 TaxID=3154386 RepID=UPI0033330096